MKDVTHHLKHTQKKVIQSVRKAERAESSLLSQAETKPKKSRTQLSNNRPLTS